MFASSEHACDQWHSSFGCSLLLPVHTVNCVRTLKVNMTVSTVRGTIASHWTRCQLQQGGGGTVVGAGGGVGATIELNFPNCTTGTVLRLRVSVPVGVSGVISVPLLHASGNAVDVTDATSGTVLWSGRGGAMDQAAQHLQGNATSWPSRLKAAAAWLRSRPEVYTAVDGLARLRVATGSGRFDFRVTLVE
jgi:hypothetical protein